MVAMLVEDLRDPRVGHGTSPWGPFTVSPIRLRNACSVDHRDTQLLGLAPLGAGAGAGHEQGDLLAHAARDAGAVRLGLALGLGARHRLERAGEHEGFTREGLRPLRLLLRHGFTPAFHSRSSTLRLRALEKKWRTEAATSGPTPLIPCSSSSDASAIGSKAP